MATSDSTVRDHPKDSSLSSSQCRVVCTDFSLLPVSLLFVCDGIFPVDLSVSRAALELRSERQPVRAVSGKVVRLN